MLFALLTLVAALQTRTPGPEAVPPASAPAVSTAPAAAIAPASPGPAAPAVASSEAAIAPPEPAVEPEPEPEPAPKTRQVCRYTEVTGQRFPVRTCRTVTVYPDEAG